MAMLIFYSFFFFKKVINIYMCIYLSNGVIELWKKYSHKKYNKNVNSSDKYRVNLKKKTEKDYNF